MSSASLCLRRKCVSIAASVLIGWGVMASLAWGAEASKPAEETLAQLAGRVGAEALAAYQASPFSTFSKDYFARLHRDPDAKPEASEVIIENDWRLVLPESPDTLTTTMRGYFEDFLSRCMKVKPASGEAGAGGTKTIEWRETGGGDPKIPGSFTIEVTPDQIVVAGCDRSGLRDGVVRLVDLMGLRQAPMLSIGKTTYRPRLPVRLGATPHLGSMRELIFLGYNGMIGSGGSLFNCSTSDVLPELKDRRLPGTLEQLAATVKQADTMGLKVYCWLDTRQKFPKDHPVFKAHPEVRGTLTWKADGEYVLCSEHPLVKRYYEESIEGIFKAAPKLSGLVLIVGGEGFYHCFMRSYGVAKGHSACPRCEKLGAETVVANLVNTLSAAARKVNPDAEVLAWPYSAEHVWSADRDQSGMIKAFKAGSGLLTEVEKDERLKKPEGFEKHLWDYSIDLIGPGDRARRQIALCKEVGAPVHIKSEAELAFEAPRLPFIPCHDRWLARADGIAGSGAAGAWLFPAFKPCYGSSVAEVFKFAWFDPMPDAEKTLSQLAARIAGPAGGAYLRKAWKEVSEAIPLSPELPSYYTGPYYLGPAQPMCAEKDAKLPEVFYGRYLFHAEITDAEGMKLAPTFVRSPTGQPKIFGPLYRRMEEHLARAVSAVKQAELNVPGDRATLLASEVSPIYWFYHTVRTEANFYESCAIRDRLAELAGKKERTPDEQAEAAKLYPRWKEILNNERDNTQAALPIMRADMRLDFYFGGDHCFPHGVDMMQAKLDIIQSEINNYLPSVAKILGVTP